MAPKHLKLSSHLEHCISWRKSKLHIYHNHDFPLIPWIWALTNRREQFWCYISVLRTSSWTLQPVSQQVPAALTDPWLWLHKRLGVTAMQPSNSWMFDQQNPWGTINGYYWFKPLSFGWHLITELPNFLTLVQPLCAAWKVKADFCLRKFVFPVFFQVKEIFLFWCCHMVTFLTLFTYLFECHLLGGAPSLSKQKCPIPTSTIIL